MLGFLGPHGGHTQDAAAAASRAPFEDLLSQLRTAHRAELDDLKCTYEAEVQQHRQETGRLRAERGDQQHAQLPLAGDGRLEKQVASPASAKARFRQKSGSFESLQGIDVSIEGSVFSLLPGWTKQLSAEAGCDFDLYAAAELRTRDARLLATSPRNAGGGNRRSPETRRCIISPSCTFRLAWDVCGLLLISYDLLTIPFNQAFQLEQNFFAVVLDWVTLCFWTGDMIQGFFLGYYSKGEVVTDHWKIVCNYLKTWLIVDAIVVVPEWSIMFLPVQSDTGSQVGVVGKIAKFARVARVLRLVRLFKMKKFLETLVDRIESEYSFILFKLAHLLCFVLVLNHVIACVWYLIGRVTMSQGFNNWVDVGRVKGEQVSYLYMTSLHWSLTQFTPASMDISARNLWERLFSVVVLLFAMLVFSSIVASITAAMTALRNLKGNEMRQFWLLRCYLRQRNIPQQLSDRVIKFLEHRSKIQGNLVRKEEVPMLGQISESLQDELMHEMHSPVVGSHKFFENLNVWMPAVMHRLCRHALNRQLYAIGDITFHAGDEAKHMFFIQSGELEYVTLTNSLQVGLRHKDWITEPVLFTAWRHRGTLQACTESELISLEPKQFMTVMSAHPRPWHYAVSYSKLFVEYMNLQHEELTDINRDMYERLMASCDYASGCEVLRAVTGGLLDFPEGRNRAYSGDSASSVAPGTAVDGGSEDGASEAKWPTAAGAARLSCTQGFLARFMK